jgi:Pilin (bacterial filament)
MKRPVVIAILALVAFAAFVFAARYLRNERAAIASDRAAVELARDDAKQRIDELRNETAIIERAVSDARQQTSALNQAVEASQRADRARTDQGKRANRIATALAAAQAVKLATAEQYQSSMQWPATNKEIGLPPPESFRTEVLRSVNVEKHASGSRIRVRYVDEGVVERELFLVASVDAAFAIHWQCVSADTPDIREIASGCSYRAK